MPDLPDNVRPPELAQLLGVGARTLDRAVAAGFLQRANGKYRLQDFVQGFRDHLAREAQAKPIKAEDVRKRPKRFVERQELAQKRASSTSTSSRRERSARSRV